MQDFGCDKERWFYYTLSKVLKLREGLRQLAKVYNPNKISLHHLMDFLFTKPQNFSLLIF